MNAPIGPAAGTPLAVIVNVTAKVPPLAAIAESVDFVNVQPEGTFWAVMVGV